MVRDRTEAILLSIVAVATLVFVGFCILLLLSTHVVIGAFE